MRQTINHKILGEFCITLDGFIIDYIKGSNAIPTDTVIAWSEFQTVKMLDNNSLSKVIVLIYHQFSTLLLKEMSGNQLL